MNRPTFASEEVTNPQLAKHNLVIVLNFLADQFLLTVNKFLGSVVSLRVIESIVN